MSIPVSLSQSSDMMLGQDFLTWLWHKSDAQPDAFRDTENTPFQLVMGQRIVVQGGEGDALETAAVSGALSPLREARFGLATGKKVTSATLLIEQDGLRWQLSLRAEDFAVSGLKTPRTERADADEDPDAVFLERIYLLERCLALLDSVYAAFLRLRLSPQWEDEARRVRAWMAEQA